jgi:HEAT repeat protein
MTPDRRSRPPYRAAGNIALPAVDVGRLRLLGDVQALCQVVRTADFISARLALEVLDDIGDPAAVPTYLWVLESLADEVWVLEAAAEAVGHARERRALPRLIALLKYDYSYTASHQATAATALGALGDPAAIPPLVASVARPSLSEAALASLAKIGGADAATGVLSVLQDIWWYDGLVAAIRTLGHIGDRTAIPAIVDLVVRHGSEQPEFRRAAAEAFGRLGGPDAVEPLLAALVDPDEQTVAIAGVALSGLPHVVPRLAQMLGNKASAVRSAACDALGLTSDGNAVPVLAQTLAGDRSGPVRSAAAAALGRIGGADAGEALFGALNDPAASTAAAVALAGMAEAPAGRLAELLAGGSEVERRAAATALGTVAAPVDGTVLIAALADKTPVVRRAAVDALGQRAEPMAVPQLLALLTDDDQPGALRARAAAALGRIGAREAVEPLIRALRQDVGPVRLKAADALGRFRSESAIAALAHTAGSDADAAVRAVAVEALAEIGPPATPALAVLLNQVERRERLAVIHAIGRSGGDAAIAPLAELVMDGGPGTDLRSSVRSWPQSNDPEELLVATQALARMDDPRSIEPLRFALVAGRRSRFASDIARVAIGALARFDDRRAVETILDEFNNGIMHRQDARRALDAIARRQQNRPDR